MSKSLQKKLSKAVILITIDALRPDHLRSYGYIRNTAPYLDNFAKKGTIFLKAITNGPETPTAFSSLFTSILPFLEGGYSPLPLQKISFPQLLQENGIYTYSIHSNPNLGRFFNYDRGFDAFLDGVRYKRDSNTYRKFRIKKILIFYIKKIINYKDFFKFFLFRLRGFNKIKSWFRRKIPFITDFLLPFTPIAYNAPYISNKLKILLSSIKKPFFIWAHFMDVHSPYNPPTQNVLNFRKKDFNIYEREFLTNKVYSNLSKIKKTDQMVEDLKILYDGEVNFVDENLNKILDIVNQRFKKNCIVIITADHGESFNEHGIFGHQGSVYEEVLKIPLIIVELGKFNNRKNSSNTVQLMDIAPTILDYFGIEIPDTFQGKSLLPFLKGERVKRKDVIISECYQKNGLMKRTSNDGNILLAIRKKEWKYIFDEEKNIEFLFNLKFDQHEKNNLINKFPEKIDEFRAIKEYHVNRSYESNEEQSKIVKAIDLLEGKKIK
ncbi:MAG: sulfatase-like hydrolase/transferase [Candidatus Thorarchaeota archaeon]